MCRECGCQFIDDHALTYKGCYSELNKRKLRALVRGSGIRDIAEIEQVSIRKVLSVLIKSDKNITPKQQHYDAPEVDEFWTATNITRYG